MELAFGLIEQGTIDVLNGGRFKIEKLNRGLHRFIHRGKKDQAEAFLTGERRNLEFGGENHSERSFAARENICEVIGRTQEPFDAVTVTAFYQPRRPALAHFRDSC